MDNAELRHDRLFWQKMGELEDRLAAVIDSTDRASIAGLLKNDTALNTYVREDLGVIAGAFGVAHQSGGEFILLQNSILNHVIYDIPVIDVDYETDGNRRTRMESDEAFALHILWRGRRERQSLLKYPPEFYVQIQDPPLSSQFLQNLSAKMCEIEGQLPNHSMLVSAEELLFFVCAWRWLARYRQVFGDVDASVDFRCVIDSNPTSAGGEYPDLWSEISWPTDSLEDQFNQVLSEGFSHAGEIYNTARQGWRKLTKRAKDHTFRVGSHEDWKSIGLLDHEDRPTEDLKRLLMYASELAQSILDEKRLFSALEVERLSDQIKDTKDKLDVLVYAFNSNESGLSPQTRELAAECLQTVAFIMLQSLPFESAREPTLKNLLWKLHKLARFPLIPTFYTTVALGNAMQHYFFSVWESHKFSVPIRLTPMFKPVSEVGERKTIQSPIVVTALLSLQAPWRKCGNSSAPSQSTLDLLHQVRFFFRQLARPIIDRGFYGGLVTIRQHQEGRDEARRAFGHQIKRIARAISDQWISPADDLFEFSGSDPSFRDQKEEKAGSIVLSQKYEWMRAEMAIVPFNGMLRSVGHALRLWAMTQSHADLPLGDLRGEQTITLRSFLVSCLQFARSTLMPHALTNQKRVTASNLLSYQDLLSRLNAILRQQRLEFEGEFEAFPPLGIKDHNARDTVWLSRLFIVVLQNCIQHGDLWSPITVGVWRKDKTYEFTIRNNYGSRDDPEEVLRQIRNFYKTDLNNGVVSEEQIRKLVVCLSNLREGGAVFDDPQYQAHSKDVVKLCLDRLGGSLAKFPDSSGNHQYPAITTLTCRYKLADLNQEDET